MKNSDKKKLFLVGYIALLSALGSIYFTPLYTHAASQVQTTGAGLVSKIAPGEFLPLSVKLVNLGNSSKVDVVIDYKIVNEQDKIIYDSQETVAVETTASFVKNIQIPQDTPPGRYIASSSIIYQDQVTPATSKFTFTVERKIFNIFLNTFYLYIGILLVISTIVGIVSHFWIQRQRTVRLQPIDYSDIPGDTRIFYELISDMIMGMRQQVGEKALEIVKGIDGIHIDENSGRVVGLSRKPSLIIAEIVSEYETALGKKVSFSFRKP